MQAHLHCLRAGPELTGRRFCIEFFDIAQEPDHPVGIGELIDAVAHMIAHLAAKQGRLAALPPRPCRFRLVAVSEESGEEVFDGSLGAAGWVRNFIKAAFTRFDETRSRASGLP